MYVDEVYVTHPARIKAFPAADSRWAGDVHAQFIVRLSAGIVSGDKYVTSRSGLTGPASLFTAKKPSLVGISIAVTLT